MTRVIRFMSANEAIRLLQGQVLHNDTDHRAGGQFSSDSIGFCFAPTTKKDDTLAIKLWAYRLSGIACMNVCLIGKLAKGHGFGKSRARYRSGMELEYTAKDYSLGYFDDWAMYGPELMPGIQILVPTGMNWERPVPITTKEENDDR